MSTLPHAKVAIVTRTKNRPVLLRRALRSVADQTHPDYVHIVVNDAGEQEPVEREVEQLPPAAKAKVKIIHRAESHGMEAASNDGLRNSESEYVVIHDDDDTWAPDFLARTVASLDTDPDVAAVATRTEIVYERVEGEVVTQLEREILAPHIDQFALIGIIYRNFYPPISILYRRSVHDAVGYYDESLPVLADWEFDLRMLQQFNGSFLDGDPLAFWHHRRDSSGDMGNSVIAGQSMHQQYDGIIRDRYLKADLQKHDTIGQLLYLARFVDDRRADIDRSIGSIMELLSYANRSISSSADAIAADTQDRHAQLAELNRNLVSQNNRFIKQFQALHDEVTQLRDLVYSQTPRQRARSYQSAGKRLAARVAARLRRP